MDRLIPRISERSSRIAQSRCLSIESRSLVGRSSHRISNNSSAGIGIEPTEWSCDFGVSAMYLRILRDRSATDEKIPRASRSLDLGKPEFHLVQPGRVGECEMETNLGMFGQEVLDGN